MAWTGCSSGRNHPQTDKRWPRCGCAPTTSEKTPQLKGMKKNKIALVAAAALTAGTWSCCGSRRTTTRTTPTPRRRQQGRPDHRGRGAGSRSTLTQAQFDQADANGARPPRWPEFTPLRDLAVPEKMRTVLEQASSTVDDAFELDRDGRWR